MGGKDLQVIMAWRQVSIKYHQVGSPQRLTDLKLFIILPVFKSIEKN
jgi:hypothetical protein